MHHIALFSLCITLVIVSHTHACAIGREEQELEGQVQVEDTNTDPEQYPWLCISILDILLNFCE
jgi:hypothetical protein